MSKKLTLLYTLLLSATIILAQQDTLTSKNRLDEVVVTANKIAQKQSSTGKVVSVISKDEIEKSTSKTVSQLLNEQAGIVITGALQPLGSPQTVNMNGAMSGHTLILLDGIPVNDPSDPNNNFDLNLLSLNGVERIEILKGAQSTLYGSDAVAGVINIITQKSNIDKPINVKATLGGGNKSTYRGNVEVYGKENKFTYNAGYTKLATDGFPAAYDSTGKGNFKKDGYDGNNLNASLQYQASNEWTVKAFSRYSQYKYDFPYSAFTDAPYCGDTKNFITGTGFQFKRDFITLTGNYQFDNLSRNQAYDGPTSSYNSISHFAEVYGNINLGDGFSLLEGGDYRYGKINVKDTFHDLVAADTSISQASGYASLIYNSKHFNVELGGRLNVNSRYGSNSTFTFNPSYSINDNYRLFGSIASGYKAPSLYQLYSAYSFGGMIYANGNSNLKPETSTNYEVGMQQQYKGFSNRLVLFYREITNGIDYNNNLGQYFNFGEQLERGFQYEITFNPIKKLTVKGNYTYLSTTQYTESRLTYVDTAYAYSLRIPKHTANLTIGYQLTPAFHISVSGKYVSKRYDIGLYTTSQQPDAVLAAYFILGANAQYSINKHIMLFADGQNITNKKFFDIYGYKSIPALFNGGVTVIF